MYICTHPVAHCAYACAVVAPNAQHVNLWQVVAQLTNQREVCRLALHHILLGIKRAHPASHLIVALDSTKAHICEMPSVCDACEPCQCETPSKGRQHIDNRMLVVVFCRRVEELELALAVDRAFAPHAELGVLLAQQVMYYVA